MATSLNAIQISSLFKPSLTSVPVIDPELKQLGRIWLDDKSLEPTAAVDRWRRRDPHPPSLCMLFQRPLLRWAVATKCMPTPPMWRPCARHCVICPRTTVALLTETFPPTTRVSARPFGAGGWSSHRRVGRRSPSRPTA
eukprot:TRINITY_DN1413_c0_g1_i5.p1 TRINITY_DN1413_c0_g1~~TRINITY_DN1413_c0_g1_i5.p1  ORF type:complete len:155 (-),score=7.02 TRINITY_DN1413_c0_g1_i5:586-1002(-)